jgi:beta-mannosidase
MVGLSGFRHLALVTVNDSDPSVVAASRTLEGNSNHTLMLRLNGVPVFGKGSNMIPMESMEGRYTRGMHTQIVKSAAAAGMTLLRVWGGGIYPLDEWFDACDDFGVLSMVDMMYGTDGQMPMARATPEQEQEYRDNVRRMSHHPSLALYYGCNECMGLGVDVLNNFVMKTVASEDDSRPIRSASPWTGYCTGVNRLTGLPNGQNLTSQYWPSCKAPPPPPAPCPKIKNQRACDPERCVWISGHCSNPPPPPPPTPSAACSFVANVDYKDGGDAPGVACDSPTACCALCNASATCAVGVWVGPPGHCYLKTNASQPYSRVGGGRYACTPNETHASSTSESRGVVTSQRPLHHGEEEHGPYFGGGGWPAINGGGKPFGPKLLIQVPTDLSTLGAAQTGYMRTETGMTSMSSFESLSALLPESEWGLETESMHERNYPCHSGIQSFFSAGANMSLSDVGQAAFKRQLYLCMLAQAMERKAAIEAWRTSNVWGLLMWQLNEIWRKQAPLNRCQYQTCIPNYRHRFRCCNDASH